MHTSWPFNTNIWKIYSYPLLLELPLTVLINYNNNFGFINGADTGICHPSINLHSGGSRVCVCVCGGGGGGVLRVPWNPPFCQDA